MTDASDTKQSGFRIKKIEFFWGKTKLDTKKVFNWEDTRPINFFYFQNWYGKSTLFRLIHEIIVNLWENKVQSIWDGFTIDKEKKIYLNKIVILIQLKDQQFSLLYERKTENSPVKLQWNPFGDKNFFSGLSFDKYFQANIFNQNEPLVYINEKWGQEKRNTTVKSLCRFNFLSDEDYYKQWWVECHLADTHKDGSGRWVLFNYVLWENIDDFDRNLIQAVWTSLKFEKDIAKLNKQIKIMENELWVNEWWAFDSTIEEYVDAVSNNILEFKNDRIKSKELDLAINKLNVLLKDLDILWDDKEIFKEMINQENLYLSDYRNKLSKKMNELQNHINDNDLLNVNRFKELKSIQDEFKMKKDYCEKNLSSVEKYKEKRFSDKRDVLYKNYKVIYSNLLDCWYKEALLDEKNLMVKLNKWDFRWDWHLRCSRVLYLIALQIYKEKHSEARTLGILFFDAPFYGVTLKNEVNVLKNIVKYYRENNINTQVFFFDTRITSYENDDELVTFFNENNDIVYSHLRNKNTDKIFASDLFDDEEK